MTPITLLAACILAAAAPSRAFIAPGDPDDSGQGWRPVHLDLEISLIPESGLVGVEGVLTLELQGPPSLGPTVGVGSPMLLRSLDAAGRPRVVLNEPHPVNPDVHLSHVRFAEPFETGAQVKLKFLVENEENNGKVLVDEDIALARWVAGWYPLPRPDEGEGLSESLINAKGKTTLHMPSGWSSVSSGQRIERREMDDEVVEVWELTEPMTRSFSAGPYSVGRLEAGGREFSVYLLSRPVEEAQEQAESLAAAIQAMEDRLGTFPYSKYGIAEVPDDKVFWYASSQPGFIMAESGAFRFGANLPLFAHEAAHAWWGNLIGQEGPGSILCSESMAQYCAVIAIEGVEGPEAATEFLISSRRGYSSAQCARGYFQMAKNGQDMPLSELDGGGWQHNLSDAKGHWVYHMLRRRIGDELFFATLRAMIAKYAHDDLSLDELRGEFIEAAPKSARLERFFSQWMDCPGAPSLTAEWESTDDGQVVLTVSQIQEGEPYDLDLELEVQTSEGPQRHTLELRQRHARLELTVAGEITGVLLDPDQRLLIWKPQYDDR